MRHQVPESLRDDMNIAFEQLQGHPQDILPLKAAGLLQEPMQVAQPPFSFGTQTDVLGARYNHPFRSLDNRAGSQSSQLHEMHSYHPSYMFHTAEMTTEYNILGDFLNNSLIDDDDKNLLSEDLGGLYSNPSLALLPTGLGNLAGPSSVQTHEILVPESSEQIIAGPRSAILTDKAREYYFQAADPAGNDTPEERMQRLLQAKYNAGMLKPFNYVKGYSKLSTYLDKHLRPAQKLKILRQLEKFRPKFREKVQTLTDFELICVEMWFERCLMEYDRVFASMAIPACCWRRSGEVFRGNKEMAELIHVPVENLRDGKIALHEILAKDSLVNYWEKFGAIAFDQGQKSLVTSCFLKTPSESSEMTTIKCCFSFSIRRDEHNIPSLIIGNFLPQDPVKN